MNTIEEGLNLTAGDNTFNNATTANNNDNNNNNNNISNRTLRTANITLYYSAIKHCLITILCTAYIVYGLITKSFDNTLLPIYMFVIFLLYECNRLELYRRTLQKLIDLIVDIFEETIFRDYLTAIVAIFIVSAISYQCYRDPMRIYPLSASIILFLMILILNFRNIYIIHWNVVARSLNMHFFLTILLVLFPYGRCFIRSIGKGLITYLKFSEIGARFVYGNALIDQFIFAFYILSAIYLSFMTIAIIRHIGALDFIVNISQKFAFAMGISPIEGVFGFLNIILSMTDTCVIIRTRLTELCPTELFSLLVTGMSTISFTALFGYVSMGANVEYLLISTIISIPCSLAFAQIFYPRPDTISYSARSEIQPLNSLSILNEQYRQTNNQRGTSENVDGGVTNKSILNKCTDSLIDATFVIQVIIGHTIAIMSLVLAIDYVIEILMSPFVKDAGLIHCLTYILSYVLPIIGVHGRDSSLVAEMFINKILINEYAAYRILGNNLHNFHAERSIVIGNIMMCGFGNISASSMLSAIISSLTDNRVNVTCMILKAMCIACIVNIFCACSVVILLD